MGGVPVALGQGIQCPRPARRHALWKANRATTTSYLAASVAGNVLLIGKKNAGALNLTDAPKPGERNRQSVGPGVAIVVNLLPASALLRRQQRMILEFAPSIVQGADRGHTQFANAEVPGKPCFSMKARVLSQGTRDPAFLCTCKVKIDHMNE